MEVSPAIRYGGAFLKGPTADATAGYSLVGNGDLTTGWAKILDVLTANRTYYVDVTNGDDGNAGTSSGAGAWQTLQKAADVMATLYLNGYDVTVNVASGTYTTGWQFPTVVGAGTVAFVGDVSTPSNVLVSVTSASCISNATGAFGSFEVRGFKLQTTTSGHCISTDDSVGQSFYLSWESMDFGATTGGHITAIGGNFKATGNYSITGGAAFHCYTDRLVKLTASNRTVTITGTPAFSNAFLFCTNLSESRWRGMTFSGSATGKRYSVVNLGLIDTNGGGASYLPGNSSGTTGTGGTYV